MVCTAFWANYITFGVGYCFIRVKGNARSLTKGENGSPKATIETDDSRSYFLIDIPARKDFVQDADKIKESDIERIKLNVSKICP
ncbi:MAG: hypothetical protein IKU79_09200 [Bacteroidaceae bacterium]|nr:hypothetical protein [Bacteroidaceae bacterium]